MWSVDRVYLSRLGTPGDTQRVSIKADSDPHGIWLWPRSVWCENDALVPLCVDLRGTTLVLSVIEGMPIDR